MSSKKIDMSIIEQLKKKRGPQRIQYEELEARRDMIVMQIQEEMIACGRLDLPMQRY